MKSGKARVDEPEGSFPLFGSNGEIGRSSESISEAGIVVGRVGAYCGSLRLSEAPFWATDNTIVLKANDAVDHRFIYSALRISNLRSLAGGAAQPVINQGRLKSLEISWPDSRSRERISSLLFAFEELTKINERRIELLEDLARSLYREWFVHFRFPEHDDVGLTEVDGREIPQGWRIGKLGEIAVFTGGSSMTKAAYQESGFLAFSAAGPDGFLDDFEIDGSGVVISAVGANCGRTFRASGKWSSIANTIKVLSRDPSNYAAWLYLVTRNQEIWPRRGSAQPFISINDARNVKVCIPDERTAQRFEKVSGSLFSLADELHRVNRRMYAQRDLLLPRLVTGKLDISDIDLGVVEPEGVA